MEIANKSKKILNRELLYFGKINLNWNKTEKYFWTYKNIKEFKLENGVRTKNPNYDKNAKPKMVEHWEHRKCFNEN